MENKNRNTKIRRTIKAAFIAAALIMFIGTMVGTNLSDLRDTGATIANAFAVLFGIMGASLGATLARSLVKIPSPSRKLLVIVSISCGAGFVIGTLLSGFILHLAFAIGLIMGVISIIAGVFAYIAAYSATIVTFAGSMMSSSILFATAETGPEADLRRSIQNDKTGVKEVAFWHALSDLEKAEREE